MAVAHSYCYELLAHIHVHVHAVVSEVTRPLFSAPSGECAGMCVCVYVQCVFVFALRANVRLAGSFTPGSSKVK